MANAAEFEPYIVWDVNLREVPLAALKVFIEEYEEGVPAAIAKHPEHGWAVIWTAGQGPAFAWTQAEFNKELDDAIEQRGFKCVQCGEKPIEPGFHCGGCSGTPQAIAFEREMFERLAQSGKDIPDLPHDEDDL
jgi:hypothetical protein